MGNGITPIAQTYFKVTDVKHKQVNVLLDYSKNVFTCLQNARTYRGMYPISLNDLEQSINSYGNARGGKINDECLLKGLYENGFSGEYCTDNVPYLFFDIDVKEHENPHLFCPDLNAKIFKELSKLSVIAWRSRSGNGIAGVLYVPQLAEYLEPQKQQHQKAGKAVTEYLSNYLESKTGIKKVKFDPAQSKFRQVRNLAEQNEVRHLNVNPFVFSYTIKEIEKTHNGVLVYRAKGYSTPYGSIINQFNNDSNIIDIMQDNGFTVLSTQGGKALVKHPMSKRSNTGTVDLLQNIYFNYSNTLGGKTAYTPSKILLMFRFNNNWRELIKHLEGLGYTKKQIPIDKVSKASKALKTALERCNDEGTASKEIYKHCFNLLTLSKEKKLRFIKDTCTSPWLKKYFYEYLQLRDYKIYYDKQYFIKNYVAEKLSAILDYADQNKKVVLKADTGKGKTTAFAKDFSKYRPNASILIIVPLTVILDQIRSDYPNSVCLDGSSSQSAHADALGAGLVFATYEQGIKLLSKTDFNYIVIDEVHQLFTANSFKDKIIKDITYVIENTQSIVIGLTGTPNQIFKEIGYKLIDVDVKKPVKTNVEIRYSNKEPYNNALTHLRDVKGRALVRLNDINGVKALAKQLVDLRLYKQDEILILYSDKDIKNSVDYKNLAHKRLFSKKTRLVLTTALIDEGLSIDQIGFTDIVFVEVNYNPRPEPIKQFFARFRNVDVNRKNYLYLRAKTNQSHGRLDPSLLYKNTFEGLEGENVILENLEVESSRWKPFSNEGFYYDNGNVNPYFLGYTVTNSMFSNLNAEQFRQFLNDNYNLDLTINGNFDIEGLKTTFVKKFKKEINIKIAEYWINSNAEVLQVLVLHTQSKVIRRDLTVLQISISTEIENFVISNIKGFEGLYSKYRELVSFGIEDPNAHLIINDTLVSENKYKQVVILLDLEQMKTNPKNKSDRLAIKKVDQFAKWCKEMKSFTYVQMIRMLKRLKVYKSRDNIYTESMLFNVLEWYGIMTRKNKNTGLITVVS